MDIDYNDENADEMNLKKIIILVAISIIDTISLFLSLYLVSSLNFPPAIILITIVITIISFIIMFSMISTKKMKRKMFILLIVAGIINILISLLPLLFFSLGLMFAIY